MKKGKLLYKCRCCGMARDTVGVPDLDRALVCLTFNLPMPESWGITTASLVSVYYCECVGKKGLTVFDLVGGIYDE